MVASKKILTLVYSISKKDFIGREQECHTESKGREAADSHGIEPKIEDLQDVQEVLLLLISWFCCCSPASLLSCLTVHWLSLVLADLTENGHSQPLCLHADLFHSQNSRGRG